MAIAQGVFGTSFETILPVTGTKVMGATETSTNLIRCDSGMPATVTLPTIAALVASQNLEMILVNQTTSGGTATIGAPAGHTIIGATTAAVSTGRTIRHDGLLTFYII